jgi:hypothetical protein
VLPHDRVDAALARAQLDAAEGSVLGLLRRLGSSHLCCAALALQPALILARRHCSRAAPASTDAVSQTGATRTGIAVIPTTAVRAEVRGRWRSSDCAVWGPTEDGVTTGGYAGAGVRWSRSCDQQFKLALPVSLPAGAPRDLATCCWWRPAGARPGELRAAPARDGGSW